MFPFPSEVGHSGNTGTGFVFPPDSQSASGSLVNQAPGTSSVTKWKDGETRILLSVWREYFPKLKNKRNTAKIWETIARDVNRQLTKAGESLFRSGEQCRRRIKNLESNYKTVVDGMGRSGNGDKDFEDEFEYFEIFNEILGSDHATNPQNVLEGKGLKAQKKPRSPSLPLDDCTGTESETSASTESEQSPEASTLNNTSSKRPKSKGKGPAKRSKKDSPEDKEISSDMLFSFLAESQKRDEEFFMKLTESEREFQMRMAEKDAEREREREERHQATMVSLFREIAKAMKD